MNEKINITMMDGATVNGDIIAYIENTATEKRYAYFTLNEIVGAGPSSTVKIYVAKIKQDNPVLDTPITDDDWHALKDIMSDSIRGNVTPNIKYLPLSEGTLVSVSERAIAMPTSYDYINKQRGLYAQGVATAVTEPVATETQEVQETPAMPTMETTMETPNVPESPTAVIPEAPVSAPEAQTTPEPVTSIEQPVSATEPATLTQDLEQSTAVSTEETADEDTSSETAALLEPIDLAGIEAKYADMVEEINRLKEKELEAAKRYNATIELNNMHKEQHANYVQNDIKESITSTVQSEANTSSSLNIETTPEAPTIEPAPITPVMPEPTLTPNAATPQNLETNWFDMPANN